MRPRQPIGHGQTQHGRLLARETDEAHDAALCLRENPEAGLAGIGAHAPIRRDRAVHEPRIERLQIPVAQAEPIEHAGPEVLDQDIGARSQPFHQLAPPRLLQVHAETLLAHVLLEVVAALPPDRVGHDPAQLTRGRTLHLDHLGAERGQAPGRIGPGDELGGVHDADAVEWRREGRHDQPAMRAAATPSRSSAAAMRKSAASFHGAATNWTPRGSGLAPATGTEITGRPTKDSG